jgi:hypothetical protein
MSAEKMPENNSTAPAPGGIESKPEQYLREIRDLQEQNIQILQQLIKVEKKQVSTKRWGIFFGLFGVLLPYIFTAWLAWTFYTKVEESVNSLKTFVVELPDHLGVNISQQFDEIKNSAGDRIQDTKDGLKEKWNNLVD